MDPISPLGHFLPTPSPRVGEDTGGLRAALTDQLEALRRPGEDLAGAGERLRLIVPPTPQALVVARQVASLLGEEVVALPLDPSEVRDTVSARVVLSQARDLAPSPGSVLLFFDEADALLGHRTEVKDSHDRYSNVETGYLLEAVNSLRGPIVFALAQK